MGPRLSNGKTKGDIRYVHELGAVAAQDAVRVFRKISGYTDAELRVSHSTLSIPLKKRIQLETAQAMLEEYKDKTVNLRGMIREHLQDVIASYQNGSADWDTVEIEQTVISFYSWERRGWMTFGKSS